MLARLALLSQAKTRLGASILTVEVIDEDDEPMQDFYTESFTATLVKDVLKWSNNRKRKQVVEWKKLQDSALSDGMDGWTFREEGGFKALPPENGNVRWDMLPHELKTSKASLKGIPALRIFCVPYQKSLVLLYATLKTAHSWQDCEHAAPFGRKAQGLALAIDQAIENNSVNFWDGHIDLTNSYEFEIPNAS